MLAVPIRLELKSHYGMGDRGLRLSRARRDGPKGKDSFARHAWLRLRRYAFGPSPAISNPLLAVLLSNGSKDVLHPSLLAPHIRRFPLALHVVGINTARILHLDDGLSAALVFH